MSRFYGSMQGSRGEATRCGTPASGITAHVHGWDLGVRTYVEVCPSCGGDRVIAELTGGSNCTSVDGSIGFLFCPTCDGNK